MFWPYVIATFLFLSTAWGAPCAQCNGRAHVYSDRSEVVMEYDVGMIFPGDDRWMRGYTHYAVPTGLKTVHSGNETVACSRCRGTGVEPGTEVVVDAATHAQWLENLREDAFRHDGHRYLRRQRFTQKLTVVEDEASGKFGVGPLYDSGALALPAIYDEIDATGPIPRVRKGSRWGYINSRGGLLHPVSLTHAGRWDVPGRLGLPADQRFFRMQAVVRDNDGAGVLDEDGRFVVPMEWNDVHSITTKTIDGYAVQGPRGWGFLNWSGQQVLPAHYEAVHVDGVGLVAGQSADGTSWFDRNGDLVLGPLYERSVPVTSGLFQVWNGEDTGLVAAGGDVVVPPSFAAVAVRANYAVAAKTDGRIQAFTLDGKPVTPLGAYQSFDVVNAHLVARDGGRRDLITRTGAVIASIDGRWTDFLFDQGRWFARDDRVFGLLDRSGRVAMAITSAAPRDRSLLVTTEKGERMLVSRYGERKEGVYVSDRPNRGEPYGIHYRFGSYGLVDTDGLIIVPPTWKYLNRIEDRTDIYKVQTHANRHGVIRAQTGNLIIPAIWDYVRYHPRKQVFMVTRGNENAVLDMENQVVVPLTTEDLDFDNASFLRRTTGRTGAGERADDPTMWKRMSIPLADGTVLTDPTWTQVLPHHPDIGWVEVHREQGPLWIHLASSETVDPGAVEVLSEHPFSSDGRRVLRTSSGLGVYDFRRRAWAMEPFYETIDADYRSHQRLTVATTLTGEKHLFRASGHSFLEWGPVLDVATEIDGLKGHPIVLGDVWSVQCMDEAWAVVDDTGPLTDCVYEEAWPLLSKAPDPGPIFVKQQGRWGVLNKDGTVAIEPQWAALGAPSFLATDRLPFQAEPGGLWGLLSHETYGPPMTVSWEPECDVIEQSGYDRFCAIEGRWYWPRGGEFEKVPKKVLREANLPPRPPLSD